MKYSIPKGRELRIAISGKSGCGNTTVSTLLANQLQIGIINYTFRNLAQEMGSSLAEILEKAKNDDSFDRIVDTKQVDLARQTSCVLGSRLAIWMLKESDFKVYLLADENLRAQRILNREGGNLEKIKAFTAMRDSEDSRRYKEIYHIDNNQYDFCDSIINTADNNPEQIVQIIIDKLIERGLLEKA